MRKMTAEEGENFKKEFNWVVKETHIELDDTNTVCLAPNKMIAERIALKLSQNNKDYYYEVEEL